MEEEYSPYQQSLLEGWLSCQLTYNKISNFCWKVGSRKEVGAVGKSDPLCPLLYPAGPPPCPSKCPDLVFVLLILGSVLGESWIGWIGWAWLGAFYCLQHGQTCWPLQVARWFSCSLQLHPSIKLQPLICDLTACIGAQRYHLCLTHGNILPTNILIDNNYVPVGLIDWQCAAWMPEYWELTLDSF